MNQKALEILRQFAIDQFKILDESDYELMAEIFKMELNPMPELSFHELHELNQLSKAELIIKYIKHNRKYNPASKVETRQQKDFNDWIELNGAYVKSKIKTAKPGWRKSLYKSINKQYEIPESTFYRLLKNIEGKIK